MTPEPPTETTGDAFDLLVIPQLNHQQPGPHLTHQQFEHVKIDWKHYGQPPPKQPAGQWAIAVAHIHNGGPQITRTITIPRTPASMA